MIRTIFLFIAVARVWGAEVALPDNWAMKMSPASVWLLFGPIADPEPYIVTVDDRAVRKAKKWDGKVTSVDMPEWEVKLRGVPPGSKWVKLDLSKPGSPDVIRYRVLSVDGDEALVMLGRWRGGNGQPPKVKLRIKATLYQDGRFFLTRMGIDGGGPVLHDDESGVNFGEAESDGGADASYTEDTGSETQDGRKRQGESGKGDNQ